MCIARKALENVEKRVKNCLCSVSNNDDCTLRVLFYFFFQSLLAYTAVCPLRCAVHIVKAVRFVYTCVYYTVPFAVYLKVTFVVHHNTRVYGTVNACPYTQ